MAKNNFRCRKLLDRNKNIRILPTFHGYTLITKFKWSTELFLKLRNSGKMMGFWRTSALLLRWTKGLIIS